MYALVLPFLLVLLVLGSLICFCAKKWKIGFILLFISVLLNQTARVFAYHSFRRESKGEFKVFSFNVNSPGDSYDQSEQQVLSLIRDEDPDFVFLAELGMKGNSLHNSLKQLFPYTNAPNGIRDDQLEPIYSKWPIDTIEVLSLPHYYHSIYRVQINNGIDSLCVYCCHLTSNLVLQSKNKLQSIREGYKRRAIEVDSIKEQLGREQFPVIVMGDFNDVSGSYTLRTIEKAGMRDAWWEKGFGYGTTYRDHGLRLRLDYILYEDTSLTLTEVKTIKDNLSDHNAITATFCFKGTKGYSN